MTNKEQTLPEQTVYTLEKDCIETLKVYDQCITSQQLGSCVTAADVCAEAIPTGSTITSEIVAGSASCSFISFGPFNPPFFREVRVLVRAERQVSIISPTGTEVCTFTLPLQDIVSATLWAPDGTTVQCQILSTDGGGCEFATDPTTGNQLICCQVSVCLDIQVKATVKLLIPSFGFCQPNECQVSPAITCARVFPPQECQQSPTVTIENANATGISGVQVAVTRTTDTSPVTITKVTGAQGIATFSELGGLAGGFDQVRFVDPLTGNQVIFNIPTQFVDDLGFTQNSNTVCDLVFRRSQAGANLFDVFINGRRLAQPIRAVSV